jgi:spermidine/putrescine transport system substrate-binding protein
MKLFILILSIMLSTSALANKAVNVYVWAGYISNKIIKEFTKETGIKVNLSEYDNNETMYAKLRTVPYPGYDVIIPSNYFVSRMLHHHMLLPLNKKLLPNLKNLNPRFLNKEFDPNNVYTLPHVWSSTGIVINRKYFDKKNLNHWADLWNPLYKDQLMILDDMREVFSLSLLSLGYSINDTDPKHIKEAYLKLVQLRPNIKLFTSDAEQTIYIDEDATIGMGWNGDINLSKKENADLDFIYPQEGFVTTIDCLAIPKDSPNPENAHKFINFIMRPDIAKEIIIEIGFSSANKAAMELIPAELKHDQLLNPDPKILERGQLQSDVGNALEVYSSYWEKLKVGI